MQCSVTKPILKWVGGKTQILDDILAKFPRDFNNYHEPFVGGGSVLLAVLCMARDHKINIRGKYFVSDANPRLINLYKNIQTNPSTVVEELHKVVRLFETLNGTEINRKANTEEEARSSQESYYYWIRKQYNSMSQEEQKSCKAAALFVFLNKTCFRGVYREGPNGFNVPFGHYNNPGIFEERHIYELATLINDVVFTCQPFEQSLAVVEETDFIYLDPPYAPETAKSFVGYTADGFSNDMHTKLFTMCTDLTKVTNVRFVMSNSDVEQVRNNFPEEMFEVEVVLCKRSINSKKPGSKTNEVIIKWSWHNTNPSI